MTDGWFHNDKPLWLPEGSIRAVITLMLIGTLCMLLIVNIAYDIDKDKFHASLGIIEALAGVSFGYYFNSRNGRHTKSEMYAALPAVGGRRPTEGDTVE